MKRLLLGPLAFALVTTVVVLVLLALRPAIWRSLGVKPPTGSLSQAQVAGLIERDGGRVEYDETAPGRPVVSVRLPVGPRSDTDILLQYVKGLPQLQTLSVSQTNVTDAGLREIQGLKHLEVLDLSRTNITDDGLENVKALTELRCLGINDTYITGAGFACLEGLTHLEKLRFSDTKVTDADVGCLVQSLRGLRSLRYVEIGYNPKITERSRREIQASLPHVTVE